MALDGAGGAYGADALQRFSSGQIWARGATGSPAATVLREVGLACGPLRFDLDHSEGVLEDAFSPPQDTRAPALFGSDPLLREVGLTWGPLPFEMGYAATRGALSRTVLNGHGV